MSFPFEHIQYLGVGIPQDGPVFLDIDVGHLHVPVHVAEAVVDEALVSRPIRLVKCLSPALTFWPKIR